MKIVFCRNAIRIHTHSHPFYAISAHSLGALAHSPWYQWKKVLGLFLSLLLLLLLLLFFADDSRLCSITSAIQCHRYPPPPSRKRWPFCPIESVHTLSTCEILEKFGGCCYFVNNHFIPLDLLLTLNKMLQSWLLVLSALPLLPLFPSRYARGCSTRMRNQSILFQFA